MMNKLDRLLIQARILTGGGSVVAVALPLPDGKWIYRRSTSHGEIEETFPNYEALSRRRRETGDSLIVIDIDLVGGDEA